MPARSKGEPRTLWKAKILIRGYSKSAQDFLFRSGEDFLVASRTAQKLLEESPAAEMTGAEIVAIDRVATLWN